MTVFTDKAPAVSDLHFSNIKLTELGKISEAKARFDNGFCVYVFRFESRIIRDATSGHVYSYGIGGDEDAVTAAQSLGIGDDLPNMTIATFVASRNRLIGEGTLVAEGAVNETLEQVFALPPISDVLDIARDLFEKISEEISEE